jgi:thioredoxin-like negative regulator of GroEL
VRPLQRFVFFFSKKKVLSPWLEELSKTHKEVSFLKVDAEAVVEVTKKFNIEAYPTLVYILNEKEIFRILGADKKRIEAVIKTADPKDEKMAHKLKKLNEQFSDSYSEAFMMLIAVVFLLFTPYWLFWW